MPIIHVKVTPNAKETALVSIKPRTTATETFNVWFIRLKAPPQEGKANKALIAFLAKYLGVTQQDIVIVSGHTSPEKRLRIPEGCFSSSI
jgi:uncharacterized protein (TIGR00251 family)